MTYRAWNDGSQNRRLMRPRGQQRYCWAGSSGLLVAIAALGAIASVLLAPLANAQVPLNAADTDLPSVGNRADYALELLRLVNAERRRRGIPPLRLSQPLNQAAQHHADDMAFNDFFSHLGSDGTTLRSRLATAGYESSEVAENIAAGRASPRETVQQWLDSPGHRANLLNPEFTEVGFGYSNSPLGRFVFYWTQVLGRPAATASQSFSTPEPAAAMPEAPEAPAEPAAPELASPEGEGAIAEPAAPAWEDGASLAPELATDPTPSALATTERPDPDDPAEDEPLADAPAAAAAEVAVESSEPAQAGAAEAPSTTAGRAVAESEPLAVDPPDAEEPAVSEPETAEPDRREPQVAAFADEPANLDEEPESLAAIAEPLEAEPESEVDEPVEPDIAQEPAARAEPEAEPTAAAAPEVEREPVEVEAESAAVAAEASEEVEPSELAALETEASSERDPTPSDREPLALLEIAGILEDGDRLLPVDSSLYDLYTFRGTAGQVVRVELESDDFDPYLFLIGPDGQQLAENDDISRDNRNSALRLTLPVDGTYSVLVNSYDPNSRGRYRLVIR